MPEAKANWERKTVTSARAAPARASEKGFQRLIQTVSGNNQSLRWSSVTQALGTLVDVSRLSPDASLFVIIEGGPQETIDQAKSALVGQTSVIIYRDENYLDALIA